MTSCPDENTLVAFASGGLSVADAARIEEHLDECGVCFSLVAELARVDAEESDPTRMVPLGDTDNASDDGGKTVLAAVPSPPSPGAIPLQLGRYTILHRLGQGAMGVVYAALDRDLGRRVALKLIAAAGPDAAERGARLLREAQALARLAHPNVVTVYDAGRVDGQVFVSMELISGVTLGEWLAARRRTWREVLALMRQAAIGLQAAHEAGVIHRDFKPSNVLVDERDRAWVVDFGLARAFGPVREDAQTVIRTAPQDPNHSTPGGTVISRSDTSRSDFIAGTPAYMAPEQYEGHGDARMDEFAFSVVFYQALFGRRPFEGSDAAQIQARIATGIEPNIPLGSDVPDWLVRILLRGMARDPGRRFDSMRAMLDAIDLAQRRRRRWGIIAIAGSAAAAVGIGVAAVRAADTPGPCEDAAAPLEAVWSRAVQSKLEAGILAAGAPHAAKGWATASTTITRWADTWRGAAIHACQARAGRSAAGDPTAACLDRRLVELRALAATWATPDTDIVEHLVRGAQSLPNADPCAETIAPDGGAFDPAGRIVGSRVRELLARGRLAAAAGAHGVGMPLVAQAVELAATLGDRHPLVGESQLALAEVLMHDGRGAESAGHVEFAMQTAITRDDPSLLVRAAAVSARLATANGREPEAILQVVSIGQAALGRIGCVDGSGGITTSPTLDRARCVAVSVDLDVAGAIARRRAGDHAASIEGLERAAERVRSAREEPQLVLADVLTTLAESRAAAGKPGAAVADLERARSIREELLGGAHPEVATTRLALAALLLADRRTAEARDEGQRALADAERAFGPNDRRVADALSNLGQAEAELGHIDLALANHRRALEIREAVGEPAALAGALNQVGATLVTLGRWDEADTVLQRARVVATTAFGNGHLEVAESHFHAGRVAHGRGDFVRAVAELEAALLVRQTLLPPRDRRIGLTSAWLARVQRDRGELGAAYDAANAALSVLEPAVDPDAWAHARLVMADVDWARGDVDPARDAVREAIAALRTVSGAAAPLAMLEAWQSARASITPEVIEP